MALLEVEDLQTHFATPDGVVRAVDGVSFHVEAGETIAIVGESGCGKSVTSMSILRLIAEPPGKIAGRITFEGRELLSLPEPEMRDIRGNAISMIFQEPMTSLNPVLTVGKQIGETVQLHQGMNANDAEQKAVEMLTLVGIPAPARRVKEYPHQLSGGMRQRVMIAMALACNPRLLIADEPTTAVIVMYAGRKVEEASVNEIFAHPLHPYTRGLLGAVPRLGSSLDHGGRERLAEIPGLVPSLRQRIVGCPFAGRCELATDFCRKVAPAIEFKADGHLVACHYADRRMAA
jgi:peptide/nickel transport system ATP-binding protein